jgi:predicted GTPase
MTDDHHNLVQALTRSRDLLTRAGLNELARHLDPDRARVGAQVPLVVVAGESGRGKSAFVNALLGGGQLSPTGPGASTGCCIEFTRTPGPVADVYLADGRVRINHDDLGAYTNRSAGDPSADVTASGGGACAGRAGAAVVGVDHPLLDQITLVDTPGFGVDSAAAALALAVLDHGDALVFVLDARAPITASELCFLERAAHRIDRVLVTITQIDRCPYWRAVAAETHAALARHQGLSRRVDLIAVSSRAALQNPSAEHRLRSGFVAVDDFLDEHVLRKASSIRTVNSGRRALTALGTLDRRIETQTSPTQDAAAALVAERQAAATRFADTVAGSAEVVASEFKRISRRQRADLRRATADLTTAHLERLVNSEIRSPGAFADRLHADLIALAADVADRTRIEVRQVIAREAERLGLPLDAPLDDDPPAGFDGFGDGAEDWKLALAPERRRRRPADRYADFNSFRSGMSVVTVLGTVRLAAAPAVMALGLGSPLALAVVALGAGTAAVRWSRRASTSSVQVAELRSWIPQQTARANADFTVAADQELEHRYDMVADVLRTGIDAVQTQLAAEVSLARARLDEVGRQEITARAPLLALHAEIRTAHADLATALEEFLRAEDVADADAFRSEHVLTPAPIVRQPIAPTNQSRS